MLNYMCRRGCAYLKYEFLFNFIKKYIKINLSTAEFILDTYFDQIQKSKMAYKNSLFCSIINLL